MARLGCGTDCAWYALPTSHDQQPWLQVDLGNVTLVSAIATQGKRFANYIKTYAVKFSNDGVSWEDYEENGQVRVWLSYHAKAKTVVKIDLTCAHRQFGDLMKQTNDECTKPVEFGTIQVSGDVSTHLCLALTLTQTSTQTTNPSCADDTIRGFYIYTKIGPILYHYQYWTNMNFSRISLL